MDLPTVTDEFGRMGKPLPFEKTFAGRIYNKFSKEENLQRLGIYYYDKYANKRVRKFVDKESFKTADV